METLKLSGKMRAIQIVNGVAETDTDDRQSEIDALRSKVKSLENTLVLVVQACDAENVCGLAMNVTNARSYAFNALYPFNGDDVCAF